MRYNIPDLSVWDISCNFRKTYNNTCIWKKKNSGFAIAKTKKKPYNTSKK